MKPLSPMPERLTLPALQGYVARIVAERGFTSDLDRVFILLVEELGELAEEVRSVAALGAGATAEARHALGAELADVLMYVADVANGLGVELGAQAAKRDAKRSKKPLEPGQATLAEWQDAEAPARGDALADLMAAAGTVARCVRKRWVGKSGPEAAAALAEGLGAVLALANAHRIDLDAALRAKEAENAQRTWTY